jgi:type IV secretory pathway VirJ component
MIGRPSVILTVWCGCFGNVVLKIMRSLVGLAAVAALLAFAAYRMHAPKPVPEAAAPQWTPVSEQTLSHGRFDKFQVYVPRAAARGFVLLLSGNEGWSERTRALAKQLAADGALVAGVDVTKFDAVLAADGAQCVYPDGDLENLSHFVQAYFHLPSYLSPLLVGTDAGATLAYASLVQAPPNTFGAVVSLGFCPAYALDKPLCKGSGLEFTARDKGVEFLPAKQAALPWAVVQEPAHPACAASAVEAFVGHVSGAIFSATDHGSDAVVAAVDRFMTEHPASAAAEVPAELGDLPLVTLPAAESTPPSDTFAIILSGDGGWAGLDKDVAGALASAGIPVVGLDSLRYFWSARTPEGLATDIDRITHYYSTAFGKQRVLLIGYSQGADVLPFAVNRLKPATRAQVGLTAIMGMSEHALFEFHVTSWISDDDSGPATLPEVERIAGMPVLCIYGSEETDTLCPKLDPHKVTIVKLKGGHHFDGDYAGLAQLILKAARSN